MGIFGKKSSHERSPEVEAQIAAYLTALRNHSVGQDLPDPTFRILMSMNAAEKQEASELRSRHQ